MPGSDVSTRCESFAGVRRSVGHDDHAGVDRVADADAAPVVHAHPVRAGRRVDQRVEDRPVGDRVGTVEHRLGLAVRARDASGIEVVSADHDGCADRPARDELVEALAGEVALAVPEPADARRQPLERDLLARELQPPLQPFVLGEELGHGGVGRGDVGGVARERRPAERPLALRRTAVARTPARTPDS